MIKLAGFAVATVVAAPFVFVLLIVGSVWRAWWMYPAWSWFIQPLGVPAISFWHFVALLILSSVLTSHADMKLDERKHSWVATGVMMLMPILIYAVFAFVHGRM